MQRDASNKYRHVKNVTYIFILKGEPRIMVTIPKIAVGQDAILSYFRLIFVLGGDPWVMITASRIQNFDPSRFLVIIPDACYNVTTVGMTGFDGEG